MTMSEWDTGSVEMTSVMSETQEMKCSAPCDSDISDTIKLKYNL